MISLWEAGVAPVLDGEVVPCDPFVPEAPIGSASVPLLIGTTRDELTFFTYDNPALDGLDDGSAARIARKMSGSDTPYDCYRCTRPSVSAKERLVAVMTDGLRVESIVVAERKAALGAAPVWMYRFDHAAAACGGALGAPHGMDVAFTFGMPTGWHSVANARNGGRWPTPWPARGRRSSAAGPQTAALPSWPAYDSNSRPTMLFDAEHTVVTAGRSGATTGSCIVARSYAWRFRGSPSTVRSPPDVPQTPAVDEPTTPASLGKCGIVLHHIGVRHRF